MKRILIIFLLLPILTYGQNVPVDTVRNEDIKLREELAPVLTNNEIGFLLFNEVSHTREDNSINVIRIGLKILLLLVLFFGIKFLLLKPKEEHLLYKFSLHKIENRMGLFQLFLWGIIALHIFIVLAIIYGVIDFKNWGSGELLLVAGMFAPFILLLGIPIMIIYFLILRIILKKGFGVISRYKKAKEIKV
ncbi:MAG TPA: hypothetical protein VIS49_03420 [Cyclobacteriaceae bacterium]